MYIRFSGFLLMLAFSLSVMANPAVFTPDFSGRPATIPSGIPLIPLCNNSMDPSCIPQWSQHAVPLAVYPQGVSSPQFQFFLPAFVPTGVIQENPERSNDWQVFTPSFSSSFGTGRRFQRSASKKTKYEDQDTKRTFYRDRFDPSKIRIVETNKKGKKTIKEKRGALDSEEDIKKAKIVKQNPEKNKRWEVFTPPFQKEVKPAKVPKLKVLGSKDQKAALVKGTGTAEISDKLEDVTKQTTAPVTIYQHKTKPEQYAIVYQNKQGEKRGEAIKPVFIPEDNITNEETQTEPTPDQQSIVTPEDTTQPGDQPAKSDSNLGKTAKESEKKESLGTASKPVQDKKEIAKKDSPADQEEQVPKSSSIGDITKMQTKGNTVAISAKKLPAQGKAYEGEQRKTPKATDDSKPGCIEFNQSAEAKTEAGFCFECVKDEGDSVLPSFIENKTFVSVLNKYLGEVASKGKTILTGKKVLLGNPTQKICDPQVSLAEIRKNFEQSCPKPHNDFNKFVKKTQCEYCKKGIPPEIMMAMISIESAGECPASLKNSREASMGLCQVNSKDHKCTDMKGKTYEEGTSANQKCFKNPISSCNKGAELLVKNYDQVNGKKPSCKSWGYLGVTERDAWRRSVSAYNSRSGWVTRGIKSIRDPRTLKSTKYLEYSHRKTDSKYKTDNMPWELLRVAYFVEKITQGVKRNKTDCIKEATEGGTGRRISCTISNLAHTEAVLGRSVKKGMVDIWALYFKDPKNNVSCSK